jgi:hypothetical protein
MPIPFGKAHTEWKALKAKEAKKGTKNVDKLFTADLGPTLDKFDAASKKNDRAAATKLAAKVGEILPKYAKASANLQLAAEFKKILAELDTYVKTNLPAAADPTTPPAKFKYMKQGNDGLCAFYALYHLSNGKVDKAGFKKKAEAFYKKELPGMSEAQLGEMVEDGNDPAVLRAFGLKESSVGASKAFVVADVHKGHFWTVRQVDGVWWCYDGLKGKPVPIGTSAQELKAHVGNAKVWA